MTVKQRQEFRIRLQKCARRKAERKIDVLEDHLHLRAVSDVMFLLSRDFSFTLIGGNPNACFVNDVFIVRYK